MPLFP